MERGRVVGLRFDDIRTLNPALDVAPRFPKLARVAFVRAQLSPGIVRRLEPIERPLEVIIDKPLAAPTEAVVDSLVQLKAMHRLVLRGAALGEDVLHRFQQKRPDVEVVLEPASDDEQKKSRANVARNDGVEWTW